MLASPSIGVRGGRFGSLAAAPAAFPAVEFDGESTGATAALLQGRRYSRQRPAGRRER